MVLSITSVIPPERMCGTILSTIFLFLGKCGVAHTSNLNELDEACQAMPWLYIMVAIVAFSALFAKKRGIFEMDVD
jgi:hypothetical protein